MQAISDDVNHVTARPQELMPHRLESPYMSTNHLSPLYNPKAATSIRYSSGIDPGFQRIPFAAVSGVKFVCTQQTWEL
jgi:hypothetical protein